MPVTVSGYICSEDRNYTYDGQFCCQDRSTKACVLSSMGKACPIASNTFCIWCPGEIIPANRTAVETVRVLDTTGKYYVQDDCVLRGTGEGVQHIAGTCVSLSAWMLHFTQ